MSLMCLFYFTVKLGKLKAQLREVEDDLVKALAGIFCFLNQKFDLFS